MLSFSPRSSQASRLQKEKPHWHSAFKDDFQGIPCQSSGQRFEAFTAKGADLISDRGTKMAQTVWCSQKKKKNPGNNGGEGTLRERSGPKHPLTSTSRVCLSPDSKPQGPGLSKFTLSLEPTTVPGTQVLRKQLLNRWSQVLVLQL